MIEEQVVIFRIQEEEYAIRVGDTKAIIQYQQTTKLPSIPDCMEGFINVCGKSIPVIRLSAKFGLAGDRVEERQIIVTQIGAQEIGIIVDEVTEKLSLAFATIDPTPGDRNGLGSCIRGIGKTGNRLIVLLDLTRLFSDAEMTVFKTAG